MTEPLFACQDDERDDIIAGTRAVIEAMQESE